ncbi:MAG: hypothetical protein GF384_01540, partial [Elusimicrobia bacterium]|nr:hypothetical protein [Elusimicrobiota bacterium]MBD3411698.1 hypothetical protein [Elusimicrobiota bacterium]
MTIVKWKSILSIIVCAIMCMPGSLHAGQYLLCPPLLRENDELTSRLKDRLLAGTEESPANSLHADNPSQTETTINLDVLNTTLSIDTRFFSGLTREQTEKLCAIAVRFLNMVYVSGLGNHRAEDFSTMPVRLEYPASVTDINQFTYFCYQLTEQLCKVDIAQPPHHMASRRDQSLFIIMCIAVFGFDFSRPEQQEQKDELIKTLNVMNQNNSNGQSLRARYENYTFLTRMKTFYDPNKKHKIERIPNLLYRLFRVTTRDDFSYLLYRARRFHDLWTEDRTILLRQVLQYVPGSMPREQQTQEKQGQNKQEREHQEHEKRDGHGTLNRKISQALENKLIDEIFHLTRQENGEPSPFALRRRSGSMYAHQGSHDVDVSHDRHLTTPVLKELARRKIAAIDKPKLKKLIAARVSDNKYWRARILQCEEFQNEFPSCESMDDDDLKQAVAQFIEQRILHILVMGSYINEFTEDTSKLDVDFTVVLDLSFGDQYYADKRNMVLSEKHEEAIDPLFTDPHGMKPTSVDFFFLDRHFLDVNTQNPVIIAQQAILVDSTLSVYNAQGTEPFPFDDPCPEICDIIALNLMSNGLRMIHQKFADHSLDTLIEAYLEVLIKVTKRLMMAAETMGDVELSDQLYHAFVSMLQRVGVETNTLG